MSRNDKVAMMRISHSGKTVGDLLSVPACEEDVKQFLGFTISIALLERIKEVALNDLFMMVFPSIFTKTFGRTLMVLGVIQYQSLGSFLLQNLLYAAPAISLIAGSVVFLYYLYQQRKAGLEWKLALKNSAPFFVKTAVKFFVVYMGWIFAMALVNTLGWFVGSFAWTFAIALGLCMLGLLFSVGLKWLAKKFFRDNKFIEHAVNVLFFSCSMLALTALSYFFIGPSIASLLVIGAITALSLMFVTIVTDGIEKAWQMPSRAGLEGVVWAFVERRDIYEKVGGGFGAGLDVSLVTLLVCGAIMVAGVIHTKFAHDKDRRRNLLNNSGFDSVAIKQRLETISTLNLEKKDQIEQQLQQLLQADRTTPQWSHCAKSAKCLVAQKLLEALENCQESSKLEAYHLVDQKPLKNADGQQQAPRYQPVNAFEEEYAALLCFIKRARAKYSLSFNLLNIFGSPESETYKKFKRAVEARLNFLKNPADKEALSNWEKTKAQIQRELNADFFSELKKIGIPENGFGGQQNVVASQAMLRAANDDESRTRLLNAGDQGQVLAL